MIAVDPAATDAAPGPTASAGAGLRFTVSARGKTSDLPVLRFLARNFATVPVASIAFRRFKLLRARPGNRSSL